MKLVVGLGNPGKEYSNTRHNVGFILVDKYLGDVRWSTKFNGNYYETNIKGEKFIFVKPLSYMNLSGGVVSAFAKFYKIEPHDILVIQDDLDLPMGKFRIKKDSSAGGHNGIKDIINCLGTNEFVRLKVGISQDRSIDTKDYVLGTFSKSDMQLLLDHESDLKDIIETFDYDNLMTLTNKYN